jgi:hypothetical protein
LKLAAWNLRELLVNPLAKIRAHPIPFSIVEQVRFVFLLHFTVQAPIDRPTVVNLASLLRDRMDMAALL